MFDKHKEAQSASLSDIQQEVKSLKSLLARRTDGPSASSPSSSASNATSAVPNSVSSPSLHHSYSPYVSPYSAGGPPNRFGMGPSQSYGGQGSPSLASIASRPPGIPAWQLPQNGQFTAATATGAPSSSQSDAANTPKGEEKPAVNGNADADHSKDGGAAKDMAESGESVDTSDASEITA